MTKIHSVNGTNACSSLALAKLLCMKKVVLSISNIPNFQLKCFVKSNILVLSTSSYFLLFMEVHEEQTVLLS